MISSMLFRPNYTYKASEYYWGAIEDEIGDLHSDSFLNPSSELNLTLPWLDFGLKDVNKEPVVFGHSEIPI